MLNAGFQYLEQRDANDTITKDGVVGKNSPFATSDNSGIYDIIAEDLRWLKENVDDVKDTSDLEAIKQSVTDMYNEMKNDSSFGEAAAKAQAEEAKKQAQAALESATNAKTYRDDVVAKSTEANNTIAEIKTYIEKAEALNKSNKELAQFIADHATVATNKANEASTSATNAKTSETNTKTSETNAKASETASKLSETNTAASASAASASEAAAKTSETKAATSASNAKTSETNAKTSETNAKTSEGNAKTSETMASNSADLSKKWAESSESPDTMNDTDSTTGKTQSSKSWAIYSKDRAISAFKSETNAKASETAAKTSETNAKTSETKAAESASNAATSESHANASETNAAKSASNAKASETDASASKSNAKTSETNAKSYMNTAKEYMQKAQEALAAAQAIQSIVDTAKANAEKCLADVEAVKESLAKMITYQGSVDNYSDLPTNPQVGYSYNVKNADKTHGVNAGDNLVWNGEDWDNFGGAIDMSLFAELGKDVKFNTVTATTFTGNLKGNADTADVAKTLQLVEGNGSKKPTTFNWIGRSEQPEWLWGTGTSDANTYAYNPSNFHVAYADNATNATTATTATHANDVADATMNMTASTSINGQTVTASGTIDKLSSLTGSTDLTSMSKLRSFVGSVYDVSDSDWNNVISIRHRNGAGDGREYGMIIYSNLTNTDSIKYKKQTYLNSWTEERMLLDSSNYNNYAPTKTGGGASGTWGINISGNAAGLSGDLVFPEIGNTNVSRKITWNGSTDGADIYYQTTENDQGNLVLNLRDDANCYLRIAANGAFKSYFSPSDGNFHGNVNGTATTALNIPTSDVGGNIWIA
nr:MAG TPA: L SHAPED TAIL FIBER PROTEIN [Caudoviricetes sp.]